jgi:hypothetical protein
MLSYFAPPDLRAKNWAGTYGLTTYFAIDYTVFLLLPAVYGVSNRYMIQYDIGSTLISLARQKHQLDYTRVKDFYEDCY